MSSAIVVRRTNCWDRQELKKIWLHQGTLHIAGPALNEMEYLSDTLSAFNYKIMCNCKHCLSFKEEIKAEHCHLKHEPVLKGLSSLLNTLTKLGYVIKSSTVCQNNDGSSSTTWILVKSPIVSDI